MDLCSLHVKNSNGCPLISSSLHRIALFEKPSSSSSFSNSLKMGFYGIDDSSSKSSKISSSAANRSFVVRAKGKKNHNDSSSSGSSDQSMPEGDDLTKRNPAPDSNKSDDSKSTTNESQHKILDWRTVRANFIARGKVPVVDAESPEHDGVSHKSSKLLGSKWAHSITAPETGCLLVATEKLDGVRTFERTVVLLLRSGNKNPREGPFGVVLNRPLHKKVKDMKPTNLDLATTFADCPLHFGGPLEASMFLLKTGESCQLPGVQEVIPGVCFGARNGLDEAAELVKKGMLKPEDFRFFVGYTGWKMDQLKEEIESDFWYIAACSENLIAGELHNSSSEGLWNEILQLMGGHYSELSRKPKQDS